MTPHPIGTVVKLHTPRLHTHGKVVSNDGLNYLGVPILRVECFNHGQPSRRVFAYITQDQVEPCHEYRPGVTMERPTQRT